MLLLQSQIAKVDRPSNRVLPAFRSWFIGGIQNRDGEKIDLALGRRAKDMLDDQHDLVALRTPADKDPLSLFLENHWPSPISIPTEFLGIMLTGVTGAKRWRWPKKYWPLSRKECCLGSRNY